VGLKRLCFSAGGGSKPSKLISYDGGAEKNFNPLTNQQQSTEYQLKPLIYIDLLPNKT
jgi:hypothetical protein